MRVSYLPLPWATGLGGCQRERFARWRRTGWLNGITVNLLDGSNNPIDNPNTATIGDDYTTTTAGGGLYSFVGLPPNETYRVQFVLPNGSTYLFTEKIRAATTRSTAMACSMDSRPSTV